MDSTPVTARLLGRYFMIDGDELERSYKHHLSDYAEWEQRDHASNWMLIEDNLGENLSIDETMLQEDLVTILSNKAGHCKQDVSIRLRTTCIFDSKLEATCSSWPKLGQVDPSWSVLPTCLAGVHGELHGCSRSRVSGAGYPPSIHVD